MIEARGLTKAYGRKQVLHDVSFTAPTGLEVGGQHALRRSASDRLAGARDGGRGSRRRELVPPTVPICRQLSALAAASGLDVRTRPDAVLESMGLADVARMAPRKLSLGIRQRLGLAAAILGDPRILVVRRRCGSSPSNRCSASPLVAQASTSPGSICCGQGAPVGT